MSLYGCELWEGRKGRGHPEKCAKSRMRPLCSLRMLWIASKALGNVMGVLLQILLLLSAAHYVFQGNETTDEKNWS